MKRSASMTQDHIPILPPYKFNHPYSKAIGYYY